MADSKERINRVSPPDARSRFFTNWAQTGSAMGVGGLIVILGWAVTVAESSRAKPPLALLYSVLGLGIALTLAGIYVFWAAMTEHSLPGRTNYENAELQGHIAVSILARFQQAGQVLIRDEVTHEESEEFRYYLMGFIDDAWGEHEADSLFPNHSYSNPNEGVSILLNELKHLIRRSTTTPLKASFSGPTHEDCNWMEYLYPDDDNDTTT